MTTWNFKRLFLLLLILFLSGCQLSPGGEEIIQNGQAEDISFSEEGDKEQMSREKETCIWVHVCGQVMKPGVYSFSEGCRVFDAIEAAGGFTETADSHSVNLAQTLLDEGKIYIPSIEESQQDNDTSEHNSDGKVNLNTATKDELLLIPGIGDKRADAIIKLREEKGCFQKIEELLEAEGIKEGIFDQIKDYIKV